MTQQPERIIVGQINGIYGVQGWVKVFSHTEPRENILSYSPWQVKFQGEWQTINVEKGQVLQGGKSIVAKLESVSDRELAREYMGCEIAIFAQQLPEVENGFYWRDLMGCDVQNTEGVLLGKVTELVETGAHDVLRVQQSSEQESTLIPFVMDEFILAVDTQNKQIEVDWLLEDSNADA